MLINQPPAELTQNLWMLGTTEYPLYLDRGDGSGAIFEGGIGPLGPLLENQLAELQIGPGGLSQIVLTHAHPDHVMAVPVLKRLFPQAAVLGSSVSAGALGDEKTMAVFEKLDGMLAGSLRKQGLIAADAPDDSSEHDKAPADNITVDRVIGEGDTVEVGPGAVYQVLETPGHSPCSLSFFDAERRVLIISDASGYYMPAHNTWWPNYFADYGQYVASLERLAELEAKLLCLSHNGAIQGPDAVAEYFAGALDTTRRYHTRILEEAASGKSPREIGESLGQEIYDRTPLLPLEFFQKNCGLMAKLSLKHEKPSP